MAVWGQYGGRMCKKAGLNPTDSPECAKLLLVKGADPNLKDDYQVTPLGTACGTGGERCIDMLIEHGAKIDLVDQDGTTCMHQTFFRGNLGCLKLLIKHGADSSIPNKHGFLPIESCFRDDMDQMLDFVINGSTNPEDQSIIEKIKKDKNLQVTSENVEKFLYLAIISQAEECYKILINHVLANTQIIADISYLWYSLRPYRSDPSCL